MPDKRIVNEQGCSRIKQVRGAISAEVTSKWTYEQSAGWNHSDIRGESIASKGNGKYKCHEVRDTCGVCRRATVSIRPLGKEKGETGGKMRLKRVSCQFIISQAIRNSLRYSE